MAEIKKMDPEIKKQWVEALRSGKYYQGRSALRQVDTEDPNNVSTYCCLGVLCDLALKADAPGVKDWTYDVSGECGIKCVSGYYSTYLPDEVQKWAGLEVENPMVEKPTGRNLAEMNDRGDNFFQIAKVIEEVL